MVFPRTQTRSWSWRPMLVACAIQACLFQNAQASSVVCTKAASLDQQSHGISIVTDPACHSHSNGCAGQLCRKCQSFWTDRSKDYPLCTLYTPATPTKDVFADGDDESAASGSSSSIDGSDWDSESDSSSASIDASSDSSSTGSSESQSGPSPMIGGAAASSTESPAPSSSTQSSSTASSVGSSAVSTSNSPSGTPEPSSDTPTPTVDNTCYLLPLPNQSISGIAIVSDPSCANGGTGCINVSFRYCKIWSTQVSEPYLDCAAVLGITAPSTPTPSSDTPTPSSNTPTPSSETPTPSSSETPTPSSDTPTPTSSETPTPSSDTPTPSLDTPTPSSSETPSRILPDLAKGCRETPTPSSDTPTPSSDTPTPSSSETPTPSSETPTPSSSETPTPSSDTPTPTSSETPTPSSDTPTPSLDTPTPSSSETPTPSSDTPTPSSDTPTPSSSETPTPTPTPETPIPTSAPGLTCGMTVSFGDAALGIQLVTDVSCGVIGGVGCVDDICRYCRTESNAQSNHLMLCSSVTGSTVTSTPTVTTSAPASTGTDGATCTVQISEGDAALGIRIIADASCEVNGGVGCFGETACRYCKTSDTPQSAHLITCPSSSAASASLSATPAPSSSSSSSTPTPSVASSGDCTTTVSVGDAAAGISAVTDPSCSPYGGLGCFSDTCRFCKTHDTAQSEHLMPCSGFL